MPSLKEVAERSKVSALIAYQVLSDIGDIDQQTRQKVWETADELGYRLNVTIRDVADVAGVSIATVSYVLNNSAPVSQATRQRVLEAAALLKYRPNTTARNLQANRTRLIGYAWHHVVLGKTNALLDRFVYAMAQAAEAREYHVLTFAQPRENLVRPFEELLLTNRVDGFIIADTNRDDPRIERLIRLKAPFAAFGRANDTWVFPHVDVDGRRGIEMAVEHLLANGHRRIAILAWPEGSLSGDARLQGYFDALHTAGIAPLPEWIVRTYNTTEAGYFATQSLLALKERPTAIVCVSDMMALGAMNCLYSAGLRIGPDVALTGFDDDPTSEFLHPPLTSLRQPIDKIATQLVEMLVAQLEDSALTPQQILLPPRLVVRASSERD